MLQERKFESRQLGKGHKHKDSEWLIEFLNDEMDECIDRIHGIGQINKMTKSLERSTKFEESTVLKPITASLNEPQSKKFNQSSKQTLPSTNFMNGFQTTAASRQPFETFSSCVQMNGQTQSHMSSSLREGFMTDSRVATFVNQMMDSKSGTPVNPKFMTKLNTKYGGKRPGGARPPGQIQKSKGGVYLFDFTKRQKLMPFNSTKASETQRFDRIL